MLISRRFSLALGAVCLSLSVSASPALAAEPATVTVRVEGLTETLLAPTQVTTTTAPVVKDGHPEDSCPGTGALGALQLATGGNWSGPWNEEYEQYEVYSIEGESHIFELGAPANYYWSFWLNEKEASLGACETELHAGDRVLFFPACYGEACPAKPPMPLGIEAPASANVEEPVSVTIKKYGAEGKGEAVAGATVTGAGATTDSNGHATLTFSQPGQVTVRVAAPESIPTETTICVHNGNDGTCGTHAAFSSTGSETSASGSGTTSGTTSGTGTGGVASYVTPYNGPYALVADATGLIDGHVYRSGHAPRVLSGTILAHSPVSSVSLELRRGYKGRCYAYDGTTERFLTARCGEGSFFNVSSDGVFSYLLPSALAPGRYVLDIEATDVAGNRTTLARGTSRTVFYVR
jgi:hypothetical protein